MIFTTLWELGNAYELPRLISLMLLALAILMSWRIISHSLWETGEENDSSYLTTLYNIATVLTITTAVIFAYAMVFVLLLLAGSVFIPSSMLESTLRHPINYVKIAWVTASVAMIAGAVGAGGEDTEAVRDATFSWRQYRRFEQHKDDDVA